MNVTEYRPAAGRKQISAVADTRIIFTVDRYVADVAGVKNRTYDRSVGGPIGGLGAQERHDGIFDLILRHFAVVKRREIVCDQVFVDDNFAHF